MTRTDVAIAAVIAELEFWRITLDRTPVLRSLRLEAKFTEMGEVRCIIVNLEGGGKDRIKKS